MNITDYRTNFLRLFRQLNGTEIRMTEGEFVARWLSMKEQGGYTYVCEGDGGIIATGKLLVEFKFYDRLGHVEDIIVDEGYRGRGLGKMMIRHLVMRAFEQRCYKVVLECSEGLRGFYEGLGFQAKGNQMVIYNVAMVL